MTMHRWWRVMWVLVGASFILAVGAFSLWFFSDGRQEERTSNTTVFSSNEAGINLSYSEHLEQSTLSDKDKEQDIVLRLTESSTVDDELLVTLRYEEGLKKAAAVTKQNVRDMLKDNLRRSYPERYPEFRQISQRDFSIDSREASEMIFTYQSPAGDTVKQRFLLVVLSNDKAAYLAAQAKETTFDALDKRYFAPIFDSLAVYP